MALIFDEFQEVETIDPGLPKLMRTVFEQQPEVAHVYLGSRRHMMERLFNDRNEPFWRSAKKVELELIEPERFAELHPRALPGDATRTRWRRSSPRYSTAPGPSLRDPGALLLPLGADAVRRRRRDRRPRRGLGRRAALGERAFPGPLGGARRRPRSWSWRRLPRTRPAADRRLPRRATTSRARARADRARRPPRRRADHARVARQLPDLRAVPRPWILALNEPDELV